MSPLSKKLRRDAKRHRAQFVAVALTMFLGITLFAATYDSFQNLTTSYDEVASEFRFANLTVTGGDVEGFADVAMSTNGVESVERRTVLDVPIQAVGTKLLGRIVGLPADDQPTVNQVKILEGAYLDPTIDDGILVDQHMADHFDLVPNDSISVLGEQGWTEVRVVGIVASPEYVWPARSRQEVITTPDNFGVIFGTEKLAGALGPGPNEVVIYFDEGSPNTELENQLTEAAYANGAVGVMTREEQPSNAALLEDLAGFEEMAVLFPILFLGAGSLAAYVTISRLVATQRPYVGVLAATGYTRGQILRHYLGYAFVPGLAGAVPGALAGILLARLITGVYTDLLHIPITVIEFYPATLIMALSFGLAMSLVAALAPSLVASRVQPAEAMRGETPGGGGKRSLLERTIPPLRRIPIHWRMALRSVGRNRRRTLYTILGVVLSLMLVLVSWGMIDTVEHLLDKQFLTVQQEDATVFFTGPVDPDEVSALEEVDGVAASEPAIQATASLSNAGEHYETTLSAFVTNTEMHGFVDLDGELQELPPEGILVGKAMGDLLSVAEGDTVTVTIQNLGTTFEETIAGFVDEPLGTAAYISWERTESLAGSPLPATSALIRYQEGADSAAVREEITELAQVAAFQDTKTIFNTAQDMMVLFYAFVAVMLVFGGAMAFALIFNSMSVNIAEREREMATLLAVGAERYAISRLITVENLLVALPGIPIGLVVGYYMSRAALATFSSDLFAFDLYVRPSTFAFASLAIVAVALLSQIPGIKAVRNIDIPKVVKERSA